MNSTNKFHIDHIDPKWAEGRDYQKVCGLNCALNFEERDPNLNRSKSNRFLPWRVAKDEIGVVPVEQGDWCQFLDLDTGEWVLADFLGTWWFEMSKRTCAGANFSEEASAKKSASQSVSLTGRKLSQEHKDRIGASQIGRVLSPESIAQSIRTRRENGKHRVSDEQKEKLRRAATGRKISPETIEKRVASRSVNAAKKKELARMRARAMSDPQFPFFADDD